MDLSSSEYSAYKQTMRYVASCVSLTKLKLALVSVLSLGKIRSVWKIACCVV